ncbi:MAG: Ig-like domain-containing protein [Burkholderiales bacterium]
MRTMSLIAGSLLLFTRVASAEIWMADEDAIHRLDAAANQVDLSIATTRPKAIAVDPRDGAVLILNEKKITRRATTGAVLFDGELKALGLENADFLALDGRDGSAWVGPGKEAGKGDGRLFVHLDAAGRAVGSLPSPGEPRAVSVAVDGSVWILGKKRVSHFTASGSLLADIDLKPLVEGEPKLLQVDSIGAWLWASAEKRLIRIDAQATLPVLSITLPKQPASIALDDIRGVLWALSEHQLDAISSNGLPIASVDLKALAIKDSTALAFDPVSRTVLVGHREGLTRFSGDGARLGTVMNSRRVKAIGVSPLVLDTTLSLASPLPGTLTNDPLPSIALQLKALCSGSDCGFSEGFYQGYSLSVLLGGQQVGPLFAIDRNSGLATYQPASRLPEGEVSLSATATDSFGIASPELFASFTIDTIAPRILSISPPDGAIFGSTGLTIRGNLDESAAIALAWNGPPQAASGTAFEFPVTLVPGANVFRISATDGAGNVGRNTIGVVYVPVTVTVDAPADGSTVASESVAVTGKFTGPPGTRIFVNGAEATVVGATYAASVPLAFGSNAVTVAAASPDGSSATIAIGVTRESAGPGPTITFHSPAEGATFVAPASIPVMVGAENADGSPAWVEVRNDSPLGFSVGVGESGLAEYYWSDVPEGTYEIIATVFQPDGSQITRSLAVTVLPDPLDRPFILAWQGMNDALRAGDKARAMEFLNDGAKAKYGPVFDALMGHWAEIIDSYSPLVRERLDEDIAEFVLSREMGGLTHVYFVYFLRNPDGTWLIDSM